MKFKKGITSILIAGVLLAATGCSNNQKEEEQSQPADNPKEEVTFEIAEANQINLKQIYGIGYPGNDEALYVATDNGLKMKTQSKWFETTANNHEYIGFQAVQEGFISSGHPEKGSSLKDPLGLVKSSSKGEKLEKIAFYGENEFYFMATSYTGKAIYVISAQPEGGLEQGVNYSDDNGVTWKKSEFNNFAADSLGMLAVHPQNGNTMAVATKAGIYYSTDYGKTVKLMTDPIMITDVTFSGDTLLFSSVENEKIYLKSLNPTTGEQTTFSIPFLDYDNPITYIAVNMKNPSQMAFSTYKNDLYESLDGGKNWTNLLQNGKK